MAARKKDLEDTAAEIDLSIKWSQRGRYGSSGQTGISRRIDPCWERQSAKNSIQGERPGAATIVAGVNGGQRHYVLYKSATGPTETMSGSGSGMTF